MNRCLVTFCLLLIAASVVSCKVEKAEQEERSSALRDYVVNPLEKANRARDQAEERFQQQKRVLDQLAE